MAAPVSWSFTTAAAGARVVRAPSGRARRRPERVDSGDRAPWSSGVKFQSDSNGVVNGVRFYKGRRTPARTRGPCGRPRHAAGDGDVHQRDGIGLAAGPRSRRRSRSPRARRTWSRTTRPTATTPSTPDYFGSGGSTTRPCTRSPTAPTARTACTGTATSRLPATVVQRRELLGRRRVRHDGRWRRHHAADRDVDDAGRERYRRGYDRRADGHVQRGRPAGHDLVLLQGPGATNIPGAV